MRFSTDMPTDPGDTSTEEILKELISIPSPSGKEGQVLGYIYEFLKGIGINCEKQIVDGENRFNLVSLNSEYLIAVHVDTVPPIDMGKKAFLSKERNGFIYGRGASDIKGGVASLLSAVAKFRREFPAEKLPVSLAFVVDEENNTALGSERLIELIKDIKGVVVLEPTYGKICTSQMGTLEFSLKAECPSVHASEFERTTNPVKLLFRVIGKIEEILGREVSILHIRGGWKHYATPKSCEALLEIKLLRGERYSEIEKRIREVLDTLPKECKVHYLCEDYEEFIDFKRGSTLEKLSTAYKRATGVEAETSVMPSWTDAANFHRAGLECVVFGFGSLKDSHTNRERISVSDLIKFRDTLYEFIKIISHEEDSE